MQTQVVFCMERVIVGNYLYKIPILEVSFVINPPQFIKDRIKTQMSTCTPYKHGIYPGNFNQIAGTKQ